MDDEESHTIVSKTDSLKLDENGMKIVFTPSVVRGMFANIPDRIQSMTHSVVNYLWSNRISASRPDEREKALLTAIQNPPEEFTINYLDEAGWLKIKSLLFF